MTEHTAPEPPRPDDSARSGKKLRGFATLDPEKQRQLASLGGKTAHARGRANPFTPDRARDAGRKGGILVSQDAEPRRAIGRRGGQARVRRWHTDAVVLIEPAHDPDAHG